MEGEMRLLVVEDTVFLRAVVVHHARARGFDPVEARDGAEGQRLLEDDPSIQAVVNDINMPVMNGLEMFHAVRDLLQERQVRFVFWSTPKGEAQIQAVRGTGCPWFGKEVDVPVVLDFISQALRQSA